MMASGEFTQDNGANSQNPGTQPSYEDLLAANESLRAVARQNWTLTVRSKSYT
ncbi:hypothetical protein PTT_10436 [Pyrenophora teres f. teres 0-1]|uniref:Uncharacterized protein n=1 Tax=Pyrenophora teres f. teres (strain 0-1) TaxID=861557 RepID=E3RP88_PYRTT|nr:hypothetical protein PTT_10436 [Pyrenophora teres f. teres 0-1]